MKSLVRLTTLTAILSLTSMSSVGAQSGQATGAVGWMLDSPETARRVYFGAFADIRDDETPTGFLIYRDPGMSFHLRSTSITSVVNVGCQVTMSGTADSNAGPTTFTVTMQDNGEPGKGFDTFTISTPEFLYTRSGILGGGEIQRDGLTCP
jgi:hypothetical protein